ncbi:immunoglobulin superfamily member 10-like isoform X2 [Xenia sp. Carnegie-2017]|uniref:immunoglobulin superfamily member 10-like isoform X2 n=1 Tax=Xenia sp. Carnegie-2017 TaxID=2897299 RepID=UPI001F04DE55|nr:immunoglobulin superfamily member 10-like isoform X2 [Xenia sp. Carnegie-2017]
MVKMVKTNLVFSTVTLITFLGLAKGAITSPPDGQRFVFLPRSFHDITWRFNVTENITLWAWSFTPRGSSSSQQIARIFANSETPQYFPSPLTFEVFKVFKHGILLLNNLNQSYNGEYTFTLVTSTATSSKVNVYVAAKPNVIINCSTPLVVNEGDNVSCVCRGEGGSPPANVTWFDKDNNIIGDVGVVSKTLVITNVTVNDGGTYRCKAQSYNDPRFRDEKSIEITVKATLKLNVVINCSTPLVVDEGDNVSCVCRGEGGIPPANVTWFDKDNNIIGDVGVVSKTLVITNVTVNDGGNYTCKAQSYNDPRFRDEKSIEVTVKATYPPQQTNITISPMSVKKGQNVTITCESDGYPEPTYTIYHNGAVVSNNKTYIIQSVNFNHAGSYRCEAKNKLGSDLSDVKNLTIITGKILSPPPGTSFTFLPGETHNITWTFDDDLNDLVSRDWFFTGSSNGSQSTLLATVVLDLSVQNFNEPILPNYDVFKPSTLQLRNITYSYDGTYEFQLRRKDGIAFISTVRVFVAIKPTVVINCPTPLVVNKGDNVSCVCRGEGGNPPANVTWFDKDNARVRVFGVESATLVIPDVKVNDNGSYRCKAQSYDDPGFRDQKSIEIQVKFKPTVSINCSSPLFVNESDNVSCVCRGEGGHPPANVTWFDKDNTTVRGFGVESATLVITGASPNDRGSYRCKAESFNDLRFIDEKSIEIIVNYKPRTTTITLSKINPKIGESVIITCESDGYPEPTYTIYHNGAVISNNKTYIIQSVNFNNAGSYRCEAKNKLGNDSSDVKNLTIIKVKPNVVINCSTPLVVNEGDNVSCVCRGEGGIPPANVTWFDKDNNIIGDVGVVNKTLVITNVTVNIGGNYTCKAQSYDDTDYRDEKSIEITVRPTYRPQQTNITISLMSVKQGQTVTITCESDGYPEPTYTIYHNGAVISNNKTYIIQSVNFSHQGSYRCQAKNKLGNDLSDVKNLTIITAMFTLGKDLMLRISLSTKIFLSFRKCRKRIPW